MNTLQWTEHRKGDSVRPRKEAAMFKTLFGAVALTLAIAGSAQVQAQQYEEYSSGLPAVSSPDSESWNRIVKRYGVDKMNYFEKLRFEATGPASAGLVEALRKVSLPTKEQLRAAADRSTAFCNAIPDQPSLISSPKEQCFRRELQQEVRADGFFESPFYTCIQAEINDPAECARYVAGHLNHYVARHLQ
jgi:hypothetical protein